MQLYCKLQYNFTTLETKLIKLVSMKQFLVFGLIVFMFSCKQVAKEEVITAQIIVDKSIEVSGGERFERSAIDFDFRDKSYLATREKGKFSLIRISSQDDEELIIDELTNKGYTKKVGTIGNSNVKIITVSDSLSAMYSASVNSVHYFSVLPYGLNDKAVNKTLLGEEQIRDKNYYKIKVTFDAEGGGEDYEDVFVYWFDKELFKLDYLAYSYNENDGKGMRFRQAYNERFVNGLRFVDYKNYMPKDSTQKLMELGNAFENNQLELLSQIELKNVTVDLIDL